MNTAHIRLHLDESDKAHLIQTDERESSAEADLFSSRKKRRSTGAIIAL